MTRKLFWMRNRFTEPLLHNSILMHTHGLQMEKALNNTRNNNSNRNISLGFRFVYGRAIILTQVNFTSEHASGVEMVLFLSHTCDRLWNYLCRLSTRNLWLITHSTSLKSQILLQKLCDHLTLTTLWAGELFPLASFLSSKSACLGQLFNFSLSYLSNNMAHTCI